MPKTLDKIKCDGLIVFSWDAIFGRPLLAPYVLDIISRWSYFDGAIGLMLSLMLRTDSEVGFAILQQVVSPDIKRQIINAAAREAMSSDDALLVQAALQAMRSSQNVRNDFAHRGWGIAQDDDSFLLLADPKIHMKRIAKVRGAMMRGEKPEVANQEDFDRSKVQVWTKSDFMVETKRAEQVGKIVKALHILVADRDHPSAEAQEQVSAIRQQLRSDHLIRPILESLSVKNSSQEPEERPPPADRK